MPSITVVGLGPGDWEAVPAASRRLLQEERPVVVRTTRHPAAAALAEMRQVTSCDDLYESAAQLEDVYASIAERVVALAEADVVYAVPGGPGIGERSLAEIMRRARGAGVEVAMLPGGSFLEPVLAAAGLDPLERGMQLLDGHALPDPLLLHLPTVIGHVDRPRVAADVKDALSRVLDPDVPVTVIRDAGSPQQSTTVVPLGGLHAAEVNERTTLFVDPPPSGWPGLVAVNRRLRRECPWDREQTHHSLVQHLVEEAYEVVDAISALPPSAPAGEPDYAAYAALEEELGDLLLQVVFHATLASEAAGFDVEEVAEQVRRKLVRRHPHVFGDVDAPSAVEALGSWDEQKRQEKERESLMDGVPHGLPALLRALRYQRKAAAAGFDWPNREGPIAKIAEEAAEVAAAEGHEERQGEIGDLLFSVVNLARHLEVEPELALRHSADRFAARFRAMESMGPLDGLTLLELDARWEQAKG
jgi:tetrapyrrole methylase family protein/MazG family protein